MGTTFDTANQEFCALSRDRRTNVKIELLNTSNDVLDTLEGKATESSISMTNNIGENNTFDYSSFNRISGSISFVLEKTLATDYFINSPTSRIRIISIVEDVPTGIVVEYLLGIGMIGSSSITRSASSSDGCTIQLEILDLMSQFNGDLGGFLEEQYYIPASATSPVKLTTLLSNVFNDMGISSEYQLVEDNDLYIYADITIDIGSTYADLLKAIMELYNGYELFFDRDGILTYRKIKNRTTDATIRDIDSEDETIVSIKPTKNDKNIKNYIEVWGKNSSSSDTNTSTYQYNGFAYLGGTNHPFSVNNIGKRVKTLSDENQASNSDCISEAKYNLDLYTNYNEQIEVEMIPDFRLIPNRVISIEYQDDYIPEGTISGRYLINQVSFSLKSSDLATITLSKLYTTVISSDVITGSNATS